ncbi:hypothetical protein ACLOJK_027174, partial [Asimina triloba]
MDHFSTATYLNVPSPHPDIPPTEPQQYLAAHYSENSDSERTTSPQPSNQLTPSATPTVPSLPAARRLKKMVKKPKRTLLRWTPEAAQAQPTSPSPSDQVADPRFKPFARLQDLSN